MDYFCNVKQTNRRGLWLTRGLVGCLERIQAMQAMMTMVGVVLVVVVAVMVSGSSHGG